MSKSTSKGAHILAINSEGGAPSKIQLLPAGSFSGRDGRAWVNSDPDAVIAKFNERGMPLVIDYEHSSERDDGKGHPAAGWANTLTNINGELWAEDVEWTEAGGRMVANREYRFLSPVFYHTPSGHISRMVSAGLTHQPNLDLKALNKTEATDEPDTETPSMDKEQRKALCRQLGLADEAADASIISAVGALKESEQKAVNKAQEPDLTKFVPRADYDKISNDLSVAQNKLDEAKNGTIEQAVDAAIAEGKIAPASKDYHVKACNREGGLEAFKAMVAAAPKAPMAGGSKTDGQPDDGESKALNEEQRKILESLNVDPDDPKVVEQITGQ